MAELTQKEESALASRMGRVALRRRLAREAALVAKKAPGGHAATGKDRAIATLLRRLGLEQTARRQFLDVRIVENPVRVAGLPPAFNGFRIAQISDLHCDLCPDLMHIVEGLLPGVRCDAMVLTGDYHDLIGQSGAESLRLMKRLIPRLPQPAFGVLGNHDFLRRVPVFEAAGLRILLNENVVIERGGERIFLCGVDDPRYFRTHDLERARRGVPEAGVAILLSHSPQVAAEAAARGYSLTLCGHTHGGQICLPGGWAIIRNAPVPRRLLAGPWQVGTMPGYTSRGTGACGVPARLFCPPEITVHTLHTK